jgi:hypothetical protein
MMMRRRGRPLVRAAATTAVVAGTAGAVRHHQDVKYANQAANQQAEMQAQQEAAYEAGVEAQQQAPAPAEAAAPAAPAGTDITAQLEQLASLHAAGVLTDEEFAAGKAKLLGIG